MDDINTQPNTDIDHVAIANAQYRNKKRTVAIVIAVVVGAAVIAGGVWWYFRAHPKQLNPTQTLQSLTDSSAPVTKSPEERADDVKALQAKTSADYTNTSGRQQMLDTLSK